MAAMQIPTGTDLLEAVRESRPAAAVRILAALTSLKTAFCRAGKVTRDIDVRHGIARTRGHVAPARSLC
jgi:hypothetical protein